MIASNDNSFLQLVIQRPARHLQMLITVGSIVLFTGVWLINLHLEATFAFWLNCSYCCHELWLSMLSSLKILEPLWLMHVWLTVFLSLHGIPAFIQSGNVLWNLTMAALVKIFSLLVFEPLCMLLIINVTVESLKKAHVCYKCITWRINTSKRSNCRL